MPACLERLLHPLGILEPQFVRDNLHVATRVNVAFDVGDFGIVEGTNNLEDTIDGADVRQEGISETCAS